MKTINYTGTSKLISRIVHLLNRKAPLPLDGDGDAVWGTNGQVLTTDGNGNTSWTTPQGGGGDVTDVEVNGTSVVNAQGVAEVSVPTATSDLNNDSGFIDGTDLSTALADYTPTASLATVATSGQYSDLSGTPSLATVATSGDYDDLTNKPTIPAAQVNSDWNAVSGVAEILNKPTIPTALADLSEDTTHRVVTDTEKTAWNGKVSDNPTFTEAATRANIASGESFATILGKIKKFFTDLKTVAFTGAYSDLSGTPDLTNVAYKNINNYFSSYQTINTKNGTAGTVGESTLVLGNSTSSGTAENSKGVLWIYGEKDRYTRVETLASTGNRTVSIPDANGTLALQEINNNFSANQSINRADGTTETDGTSTLVIGNNISSGTVGNSRGRLFLYGTGVRGTYIVSNASSSNKTVTIPNASGTMALKEVNNGFSASQTIDARNGTTSAVGYTDLNIGNNVASGTAENSTGVLRLYGNGAYYGQILAQNVTANRSLELPNKSGTIALTDDARFGGLKQSYTFPKSAAEVSGGNDSVSITKNGTAFIHYTFANSTYSQFFILVNGNRLFDDPITSSSSNLNGTAGVFSFPVFTGDTIKVSFYSTFAMGSLKLRVY